MSSDKIIDRIRKCLKLGRDGSGATEAEAAAAISAAKKLMAEHNIKMSDIEFKEEVKEGVKSAADTSNRFNKDTWELAMAKVCDNIFNVEHYLDWRTRDDGRLVYRMIFVGVGVDADIAAEVYTTLLKIVRNMGTKHGYVSADHRSYCAGVVRTLRERSEEYIKQEEPAAEEKCRDMVIVKNQLIKTHLNGLGLKPIKGRSGPSRGGAYDHGIKDGKNVNLDFRKALK